MVSSWFYTQLQKKQNSPERVLILGTSDYSTRVTKWSRYKREAQQFKPLAPKISLANEDGGLNFFRDELYTLPMSGTGKPCGVFVGFPMVPSSDQALTMNPGFEAGSFNNAWVTSNSTVSVDSTSPFSGNYHAKLSKAAGTNFPYLQTSAAMPLYETSKLGIEIYTRVNSCTAASSAQLQGFIDYYSDTAANSYVRSDQFMTLTDEVASYSATTLVIGGDSIMEGVSDINSIAPLGMKSCRISFRAYGASGDNMDAYLDQLTVVTSAEYTSVFRGTLQKVKFSNTILEVFLEDKFFNLKRLKLGADAPLSIASDTPGNMVFAFISSYGGYSTVMSISNPDIDYASWKEWDDLLDGESTAIGVNFDRTKITDAVEAIARTNDSAIYPGPHGRIMFAKYSEASSLDHTLASDDLTKVDVLVDPTLMINKQWVYGNYDTDAGSWGIITYEEKSASVNSYGLHENIRSSEDVWFVSSAIALNMAQRQIDLYSEPPQDFEVTAGLGVLHRNIGDTLRIVDPVLGVTSVAAWRMIESSIDMDSGESEYRLTGAVTYEPFRLDIDSLDHTSRFLL